MGVLDSAKRCSEKNCIRKKLNWFVFSKSVCCRILVLEPITNLFDENEDCCIDGHKVDDVVVVDDGSTSVDEVCQKGEK